MKRQRIALLLAFGFVIWLVGTVYYAYQGPVILESTRVRYWIAFVGSPIFSGVLCLGLLRWLHIAPADWTSAVLLVALPGMVGEVVVLSNLSTFMPRLHASSGGNYAAFLFAAYALVLAVAEVATLRAAH